MTAAQLEEPVLEGIHSLEVRWIFPGPLRPAMADWFARFPAHTEAREDAYLLRPFLDGLSVKICHGEALEVKAFHGSPGQLTASGRPLGPLEHWQKWSFPCGPLTLAEVRQPGWVPLRKRRQISRFPLASGQPLRPGPRRPGWQGCAVELSEFETGHELAWSLGFETTGPGGTLRSELQAVAGLVFAQPVPAGIDLGPGSCQSYSQWLAGRPPG